MMDDGIEDRRRKLSRHYELVTVQRMEALGYCPPHRLRSVWKRLAHTVEIQLLPHYFGAVPRWRLYLRECSRRTRTLPDFCVVGAIKSGTTDLAISLMLHPNVMAPLAKEFWSANPENWRLYYPTQKQKQRHLERHGAALAPYFVPALHSMEVAHNLSRVKPDTRIVLILRNPVERTFSQWKWEVFLAGKRRLVNHPFLTTFRTYVDTALELFPESEMPSICGFPVLQTSIYWRNVNYWIKCFGRDNVLVLDVEDYFRDRNGSLRTIQAFVGLPWVPMPAFTHRINENPVPLPPPEEDTMAKLTGFFAPHNEKLWTAIGANFGW
jgi:hypothetical protein